MNRIVVIILSLVFCSACAPVNGRAALAGVGLRTSQQEATMPPQVVMASSRAKASPKPATPNAVATQLYLVNAVGTAQAQTAEKQAELDRQNLALHKIDLDIAVSNENTAKYMAVQKSSDAIKAAADAANNAALARQREADNQAALIKLQQDKAAADAKAAEMRQYGLLATIIVIFSGVILLAIALLRPSRAQTEPEDEGEDAPPEPATSHYFTSGGDAHIEVVPPPPGGITQEWLLWAHLARLGNSLAYNKMTGKDAPYKNSADYQSIYLWAYEHKIITRNPRTGVTVLTTRGEKYCDDELCKAQYHAPTPPADESQIVAVDGHVQDNPVQNDGGGQGEIAEKEGIDND